MAAVVVRALGHPARLHLGLRAAALRGCATLSRQGHWLARSARRGAVAPLARHGGAAARHSSQRTPIGKDNTTTLLYVLAIAVAFTGGTYAAVPLYRLFCQATGFGGTTKKVVDPDKIGNMTPVEDRKLRIRFNGDTSGTMQWKFQPQQPVVQVVPGETALAFFKAENPTDEPITGISTYNVIPFEAGQYFNKIQCFCFEEQRLNPGEEVSMPVFFYIDSDFALDPAMEKVTEITLSYTFFLAREADFLTQSLANPHAKRSRSSQLAPGPIAEALAAGSGTAATA